LWETFAVRSLFTILLGTALAILGITDSCTSAEVSPSVAVLLPSDIPSETVQIVYHLVGPFGGRGGYNKQEAGLHSYEIASSVEGKAATEIRMIVYAPGCEIQTFVVPLAEDSRVRQRFECHRVPTVTLSGQIEPTWSETTMPS
jgi:hypothetical protein